MEQTEDNLTQYVALRSMIRTVTNIADELETLIEANDDLTPEEIVQWLRVAVRILKEEA